MKKTILAIAVISLTAFVSNAQTAPAAPAAHPAHQTAPAAPAAPENPNAPEIVFEMENIDYGTIPFDSDGNRQFKFKNTGKEPLIIYSATGSCGCTVPTKPEAPILPGKSDVIKVHYDTKRVGSFEKTITVTSNGKTPSKTLKIHGTVKAAENQAAPATGTPTTPGAH